MTIPFTIFRGWVKNVDFAAHGEFEQEALNAAFPGFYVDPEPNTTARQHLESRLSLAHNAGMKTEWEAPFAYRRYSGGVSLARGSYYSVCRDSSGNDDSTLVQEMLGYVTPSSSEDIEAVDLTAPESKKLRAILGTFSRSAASDPYVIAILFRSDEAQPSPFLQHRLGYAPSTEFGFPVFVRPQVAEMEIPNTIDLRLRETQEWLVAYLTEHGLPKVCFEYEQGKFRRTLYFQPTAPTSGWLNEQSLLDAFIEGKGLGAYFYAPREDWDKSYDFLGEGFIGLLPFLLCPRRGGSPITEAIGWWLRSLGAEALVYPSARADVTVEVQEGRLVGSSGWCLVDFRRSASPPQRLWLIQAPDCWRYLHDRVGIQMERRDKTKSGSWAVVGNTVAHRLYRKLTASVKIDALQ